MWELLLLLLQFPSNDARKMLDGCVVGTQLGTPRGRYDEHISKFPLV
jgi:hypothetical protein